MKNYISKMVVSALAMCGAFAVYAGTVAATGGNVSYNGAKVTKLDNGDVVLVFDQPEGGSFSIPTGMNAKARIVAVGGGGAGGTVGGVDRGAAGGGGGGGVSDRSLILDPGDYSIIVGVGGQKAQNYAQSWIGDDGETSAVSNTVEKGYIISAKGGGGGGSVKISGEGTPGASGGGGSWFGEFLAGGAGTEGYGWAGGTPTDQNIGGGGGGASSISTIGVGGADGRAGEGRTNDITGVMAEYGRGGRGGRRGDSTYVPANGASYGCGGDGAVDGLGGKGASGVVIVRIEKLFSYKFIDYPNAYTNPSFYTNTFVCTKEESNCIALDLGKAPAEWIAGIDHIEGVTNGVCSYHKEGTNTIYVGTGRREFVLYLNEEYKWKNGTDEGSTYPCICSWYINPPDLKQIITVDVKKTVDWFEGTNATIAIDVHSTPERREKIPNVLFLGSMCYKHGLTANVVKTALDTILEAGNLDAYFFLQTNSKTDSDIDNPVYEQHLLKGATVSNVPTADYSNMHGTLYAFYEYLDRARLSGKDYDYIVFSFDRTKVATTFPGKHEHESEVSQYIKEFYDRNAVIWMVDNQPSNCTYSCEVVTGHCSTKGYHQHGSGWSAKWYNGPHDFMGTQSFTIQQTPWFASPLVVLSVGNDDTWYTLKGYKNYGNGASTTGEDPKANYKALMGIFSPDKYATADDDYTNYGDFTTIADADTKNRIDHLSGQTNVNQVVYNNAQNVAEIIKAVVKPTIATMVLEDHIYLQNGLKINATEGYWTTNEVQKNDGWTKAQTDWTQLTNDQLSNSDEEGVRINLGDIDYEVWLKLKVGVYDTGRFLSSVDATYNERTGQWEKDPNYGPVQVKMLPKGGTAILAQDQASTTVEWSFEAFKITGGIINEDKTLGEFIMNGFYTDEISVAKGYNPEVLFKGAPGWAINYINVDGVELDDVHYKTNFIFQSIAADHDIRVGFTNILINPPPPEIGPITVTYDGNGYAPETTVQPTFSDGYEEYSNHWYMVYTTDPDVAFNTGNLSNEEWRALWSSEGPITDVVLDDNGNPMPQTVYARVCLDQPGYENGALCDYWIGTNTVTILPREITLKVNDQVQVGPDPIPVNEFSFSRQDDNLVPGETPILNYSVVYPGVDETSPITATATIMDGGKDVSGNYVVTIIDGTYKRLGTGACAATAEDYRGVYDGNGHTIQNFEVLNPTGKVDGRATMTHPGTQTTTTKTDSNWTSIVYYDQNNKRQTTDPRSNDNIGQITDTITTTLTDDKVTENYSVKYSIDGGNTWLDTMPQFTDVGSYNVQYKVEYSETHEKTYTRVMQSSFTLRYYSNKKWREVTRYILWPEGTNGAYVDTHTTTSNAIDEVTFTPYYGSATVTITPKDVVITAGSTDGVIYNGGAVSNNTWTITDGGFVKDEGIVSLAMKDTSAITLPGTVKNEINPDSVVFKDGTKASNYNIRYVDGSLSVDMNQLAGAAVDVTKLYDNESVNIAGVTVTDQNGQPLVPGTDYTIVYKRNPWDEYTSDLSSLDVTDAGEYPLYYKVIGADGYGSAEGHAMITINPIPITITAKSKTETYDPMTGTRITESGYEITEGSLADGDSIDHVNMTSDSFRDKPGTTKNRIEDVVFSNGKSQNYIITYKTGELTLNRKLAFDVVDDGEFSWFLDLGEGVGPGDVIVLVDGKTNQLYKIAEGEYAVHVAEPTNEVQYVFPPDLTCVENHHIEFIFTEDDGETYPDKVLWYPQADTNELYAAVINLDPPTNNVEEIKTYIDIYNDPYSGWLPVYETDEDGKPVLDAYGNKIVTGLRTSDGAENKTNNEEVAVLESRFQLVVTGTGEITFEKIEIPVADNEYGTNPDNGKLKIIIDGVEHEIPPLTELNEGCTVVTNNGIITITDLTLTVTGNMEGTKDSDTDHYVTLVYTRTADDPQNNSAAYVEGIYWKTFGETDDGGTSWIQDKKVWIIDHEDWDEADDYVYLCFRPLLKVDEEVVNWVTRSSETGKIKVKWGDSEDDMEKCEPATATLSEKPEHAPTKIKVWVRVLRSEVNATAAYWKIYIEGSQGTDPVHEGDPVSEGESTETENTFGVLTIISSQTNTMIAIPWTDYTYDLVPNVQPIKIEKLVKPEGFEDGDMLYAYTSNETYSVWMLDGKEWIPQPTFVVDSRGSQSLNFITGEDGARANRGGGIWAVRQHPVDENGNPKKIYVHGQATNADASTDIVGAANGKDGFTMMGSPFTTSVNVNDIDWGDNPMSTDVITIPSENQVPIKLTWKKGKWGYTTAVPNSLGRLITKRVEGYELQPGRAFWYTRRGAGFRINWPKKNK